MKRSDSCETAPGDFANAASSLWEQLEVESATGDEAVGEAEHDACLMESFFSVSHELLNHQFDSNDVGSVCQKYLSRLGFDLEHVDALPVGLFVDHSMMHGGLLEAGYNSEELDSAGLLADQRLAGRVIGPIRGLTGRITGFWARHPEGESPKYLYFSSGWKHEAIAFGLDLAIRACQASQGELVLIDDILDVLLLQSSGMLNVASLLNSATIVTPKRWQRFASLGIERVTLVMNGDQDGASRTLESINNVFRAASHPVVYVVPADEGIPFTSPGDYVRATSVADFVRFIDEQAVHAYFYHAWTILKRHRGHGWTETSKRAALDEAIAFYTSQAPADRGDLDCFFVPPIVDELGLDLRDDHEPGPEESGTGPEPVPSTTVRSRRRSGSADCLLHGCGETDCFCFD